MDSNYDTIIKVFTTLFTHFGGNDMKSKQKPLYLLMVLALLAGLIGFQPAQPVQAGSQALRISQAYGGGGNSGSTYTHDFIELYNSGSTPIDLNGWSVQYASSKGTSWSKTELSGTIPANGYFLIQEAKGLGGTTPLPTPDVIGTIAMGATGFKVALVDSTTLLTGACPIGYIDLIGAGTTASCYEGGGRAPAPSNTTAIIRNVNGCMDTDNNNLDFQAGSPTPRNSASTAFACPVGVISTVPADNAENVAVDADITILFSEAVIVTGDWFTISCTKSGNHTAAMTDADPVFTLAPAPAFSTSETCTVTILADYVDADDAVPDPFLIDDYSFTFDTVQACGDPFTPIYKIQGSGDTSPLVGDTISTEGIVVGDFQVGGKDGFYIQDETGDGDDATSDGIFVYYKTAPDVNVGDKLRLTGAVSEYNGLTQVTGSFLQTCSTGNTITPVELSLPFESTNHEHLEGMLVAFPQALVISEYFNFDRYGELLLTSERHSNPTAVVEPGQDAIDMAEYHLLDSIAVDDGSSYENPSFLRHPDGSEFGLDNYFRGGDTVADLTGVMDYNYGAYKIQPVGTAIYEAVNPRTDAPELVPGEIRIASLNVLNYFVTIDEGPDICGPLSNMDCRGADDANELERQQAKIINAILGMDADIVGLIEIENEHPELDNDAPVISLVELLNAEAGAGTYDYIATGPIGTDAIKQAILYKTEKVVAVGDPAILDSSVDPDFIDDLNRPSLAQSFEDKITGEIFTVSVNHLKSKGSACDGDPDLGDGAGNCNLTRKAAAEALVEWLETDPTDTGSDMYLIIGDLNSYTMEDPIDMIKLGADDTAETADDYFNLVERFQEPDAYGYVYSGQTGYLDHALGNRKFASYVLDANFWHINADEADLFDYDTYYKPDLVDAMFDPTTPYRSSDHDPVLISVLLNHPPVATDDNYTVERMGILEVEAPGVLDNDVDVNIYDNITASLVIGSGPEYGTLEFNSDGSFTYTPDRIFTGEVTFEYIMRATPGLMHDYAAIALVTITVTATGDLIYLPIILK